ncbi:MAG: PorT family protein [Prevotellaceae bacterium]|jgi:hypothetical protein|nr:PorT family protein [Prevotellaceae bacterium]
MKLGFKSILLLFLLSVAGAAGAQMKIFNIPLTIAFEAGYSDQLRHGKETGNTNIHGIRLASLVEFTLPLDIRLQTGAIYTSTYSYKDQGYPYYGWVYSNSFGHSINIPLHAGYELPLFGQFKVFGFLGPTLGIGLRENRLTYTVNMTDETIAQIKESGFLVNYTAGRKELYEKDDAELKRLNWMASAGGGIRFKNYYIKSGYDFGINSINAKTEQRVVQSGWYVVGGYTFDF